MQPVKNWRWSRMSKRLALALFVTVVGVTVCALPGQAQGGFLSGRGAGMRGRPNIPFRGTQRGGYLTGPRGHRFSHRPRSDYLPYLYFPYYYSDYYSGPARSEEPPSRVVVVENSSQRTEAASPPPPPPEPLVLELQGNHWVRITSAGQAETNLQPSKPGSAKASNVRTITPQQSAALEPTRKLPPAVLVFRDGHKEEITRYTIIGGTIYTGTDYWNNGSWTRKVPIAELNIPATLKLNQERGAKFSLPSGPSVVVIRP